MRSSIRRGTGFSRRSKRSVVLQKGHGDLLEKLWGIYPEQELTFGARLDAYFDHYRNLLLQASTLSAFDDHRHVIELIETVRDKSAQTIHNILIAIKQASSTWIDEPFNDDEALQALQFATRLWLFSTPRLEESDRSLNEVNRSVYAKTGARSASTPDYLSSDFCAKSLTRRAGFYLVWTSDLSEHLTFASKDQLRVFRHAHVLQQYQRTKEGALYPPGFLSETHRTIHLLFPFEDYATSKRVRRIVRREQVDIEASAGADGMVGAGSAEKAMEEHEKFQLASYRFYGARLAEVQRRYDLARPRRLAQWWYDRRQRPEWAALMVALVVFVLTVLFGIAQTVTGILQIVASWHP